jgi:hypothetical protein
VVLRRELVILPSKQFTVVVIGGVMSGPGNRPRLLRPSEIRELIYNAESDQARKSSDVISGEESSGSVPGVSQPQPYCQTASCHKSCSSISSNTSDKDDADKSGSGEQTQEPVILKWICPSCPQSSVTHTHTHVQGPRRKEAQ